MITLKKIFDTFRFEIIPILSHPLVLLILGSFIFSSMIAKYNNISSRNMAVVSAGLIPAGKAYLNCEADIQAAEDYYESIRLTLLSRNEESYRHNAFMLSSSIKRNIIESNALDRRMRINCDLIYEILNFQAEFLGLQKDFEKIKKIREQRIHSTQVEKIKIDIQIGILNNELYPFNLMQSYDEYEKAIIELQFIEARKYAYEMDFYLQSTHLFEEKLKEIQNKKVWNFLF